MKQGPETDYKPASDPLGMGCAIFFLLLLGGSALWLAGALIYLIITGKNAI